MTLQILRSLNVEVGDDGAEAEGVVGVKDVDALSCQFLLEVCNEVGIHNVVVLGVAAVEHRSEDHSGVACVVSKQGGLFKTHPVLAVDGTGDGVAVAVKLVLAVIGNGDVAVGLLGDHLSELLGRLVVPLGGLEDVGELEVKMEVISGICRCSVSCGSCIGLGRIGCGSGSVVVAACAQCKDHDYCQKHCNNFFHLSLLSSKIFRFSTLCCELAYLRTCPRSQPLRQDTVSFHL